MANFANPTVGSNYTDFPGEIRTNVDAALQQLSVGSHTNIPTGAIKFDTSANRWKKYNGSAFVDLTSTYDLNANVSVNQLNLGNNERIRLGDSQQLQIYTNGTHSYIQESGSGALQFRGANIIFDNADGSERYIDCNLNGSVELYNDNIKRLETTANGIQVTNRLGIGRSAVLPLDVEGSAQIGAASTAGAELRIGRSGSGNRNAFIDFIGDDTYTDAGFRIIRNNNGQNAASELRHRGTGGFNLINQEAAPFQFKTSGTTQVVITSAGRLGIGVTNPQSLLVMRGSTPRLTLEPTADTQNCRLQFATTDGTIQSTIQCGGSLSNAIKFIQGFSEILRIDTSGRLLVGTSTGRTPSSNNPKLQVEGTNSSTSSLSLTRNSNDGGSASFIFNKSRGTSVGSDTVVQSGDTLGIIQFVGNDGTDSDTPAAWIAGKVDGNPSSNVMPGRLEFYTNTGSSSLLLRATIKEGGAFLIGKTSPAATGNSLETAGSARFQAPSDFWASTVSFFGVSGYGYLGTHGAFETTLVSGGYRKGSSLWQNYTINGVTGNATMIAMGTQSSYIALRLETGKATGSSSGVSERFRFFPTASLSIASTTEKTKLYINGGESENGAILVENVLYSSNQDKPILIAGTQNWTGATTNWGTYGFQIRMKTNSSSNPRMTVDTDNGEMICVTNNTRVGIGTQSPDTTLHVHKNSAGSASSDGNAVITAENNNHCIFQMLSPNNVSNRIMFGDPEDDNAGEIQYNHNNNSLIFQTAGSQRININSSGQVGISTTAPQVLLDVGGVTTTGLSGLSNSMFYAGFTNNTNFGGVVLGSGVNGNTPFIASSKTSSGTNLSLALFAFGAEAFRINQNGLRIGQTSTDFAGADNTTVGASITKTGRLHSSTSGTETGLSLNANTTSNSKHYLSFRNSGTQIGSVTQNGATNVQYNVSSDRRLKENIVDLKDALTNLLKLQPRKFNFIADESKQTVDGLIAQEVEETGVCPNAVWKDKEDKEMMQIDYSKFMTLAIAAIQELAGKVSDLESKLA